MNLHDHYLPGMAAVQLCKCIIAVSSGECPVYEDKVDHITWPRLTHNPVYLTGWSSQCNRLNLMSNASRTLIETDAIGTHLLWIEAEVYHDPMGNDPSCDEWHVTLLTICIMQSLGKSKQLATRVQTIQHLCTLRMPRGTYAVWLLSSIHLNNFETSLYPSEL